MAQLDSILPGSTGVSHLKNEPALISGVSCSWFREKPAAKAANCKSNWFQTKPATGVFALIASCLLVISSGCASVQIPSYRLEDCSAECYSSPPIILPAMPAVPMPGWLARWKAERDLPKPPAAPRFHPLPTRPMFQPGPSADMGVGAPGEAGCYGTLPVAQSWSGVESVPAAQAPTLASPL